MSRARSLRDRLDLYRVHPSAVPGSFGAAAPAPGADVFIVHGHDGEAKQTVARFLSMLTGRAPIILHEQPNQGRTIVEKFEEHDVKSGPP